MFQHVLVAVDGSPWSDHALAAARSLVTAPAGRLTVVHVTQLVGGKGGVVALTADEDQLRERLKLFVERALAEGITARLLTPSVFLGGPAYAIGQVADEVDADVIVVGNRGHSALGSLILGGLPILGGVPVRLLQTAHRPVLVIPLPPGHPAHPAHPEAG